MSITCTCGRVGEHCPSAACGSINKHPLIQRSLFMSKQVGADVRFYRCRKCGTEYGFLRGVLFDAECNAPEEVRLGARQLDAEDEVKLMKDAIALLESKGLKVVMADEVVVKASIVEEPRPSAMSFEEMEALFKKKEPPTDESNH